MCGKLFEFFTKILISLLLQNVDLSIGSLPDMLFRMATPFALVGSATTIDFF